VIIDTSVLFAAANRRDSNHSSCRELIVDSPGPLAIPALVLAEASYLISKSLGAPAESALLRSVTTSRFEVIGPTREDLLRMAVLTSTYEDLPLGATDASIVALAERLNDSVIELLIEGISSSSRPSKRPRHCSPRASGHRGDSR
jgi:uncharacterized protein